MPEHESTTEPEAIFSADDFPTNPQPETDSTMTTDGEAEHLRDIGDLNLAQLLVSFRYTPSRTWDAFLEVLRPSGFTNSRLIPAEVLYNEPDELEVPEATYTWLSIFRAIPFTRQIARLILYIVAFGLALTGGGIWAQHPATSAFAEGLPYIWAAFLVWIGAEVVGNWRELWQWAKQRDTLAWLNFALRTFPILFIIIGLFALWDATDAPTDEVLKLTTPAFTLLLIGIGLWLVLDFGNALFNMLLKRNPDLFPEWMHVAMQTRTANQHDPITEYDNHVPFYARIPLMRVFFGIAAAISSVFIWLGTSENIFPTPIIYLWIINATLWALTFAPTDFNIFESLTAWIDRVRRFSWRDYSAVIVALVLIMGVATWFRFNELRENPREMTDDHVELILDAGLIRNGERPIFLANNGGREPFQMYLVAFASYFPSLGIDHFTIKVIAALESILTIPILFWMGYELTAGETKRRRLLMGVFTAALVAGSYWHVAITRQALRIPLTPLIAALLLIFLARAIRHNRRADYIITGLILGFGLYMYQAVRMLPVVIVIAVAIAVYFAAKNWRQRWRYGLNLAVLVWMSFMVFLPMFHYSVESPDQFWRRTAGRLLGDDVITETLPDGSIVERASTLDERFEAFQDNIPVLMSNVRNALLMFNRKGDVAAISGVPNQPAMNTLSGALLIVGTAAWLVLAIRRRNVVYWLIPAFIFIMLLPSALSIAFPVENPSHTRTSGAIPGIFLIAALPLTLIAEHFMDNFGKRRGQIIAVVFTGALLYGSYSANSYTYFEVYPPLYAASFDPYTEPGRYLQGFALINGGYGNAFMIGYPHWWSHRAIGLAAGLEEKWPNGIVTREQIPTFLSNAAGRSDKFRFDPERDILFFYSPEDTETGEYLAQAFPDGYARLETVYSPNNDYMVYIVPALGTTGFQDFLSATLSN